MKIVFLGDIVAEAGRKAVKLFLPRVRDEFKPDFVIANGENASGGIGLTPNVADDLLACGIDLLTSGNHIWKHKEIADYLDRANCKVVRPMNYPYSSEYPTPGKGFYILEKNNKRVAVLNLLGRVFLDNVDCPFDSLEKFVSDVSSKENIPVVLDFHAEATSEKIAMGWFVDGRVAAVLGTHTHVQTADNRILPHGTAFISDVGMCGAFDSVIGVDADLIIKKLRTQRPVSFKFSEENKGINGVMLQIDEETGKAVSIEKINIRERN